MILGDVSYKRAAFGLCVENILDSWIITGADDFKAKATSHVSVSHRGGFMSFSNGTSGAYAVLILIQHTFRTQSVVRAGVKEQRRGQGLRRSRIYILFLREPCSDETAGSESV